VLSQVAAYHGRFGAAQAERLLWRAGFGPRKGESRRRDERDRSGAGNDQIAATGEAVRVEAAPAGNEPLSAVQIGEEDAAPVGGEGERVRTEGDVAAVKTDAAFV
jgi:hypothetical protein